MSNRCLRPAFSEPAVPVVFAANDRFVPYLSVCLQSLLEQTSSERRYDVIILHTDIIRENREALAAMTACFPWISLRFFNPEPLLEGYALTAGGHITRETYFRFLIPEILPDYDKVLYLDCDLLLQEDPALLYDTDVSDVLLAAALDPEFSGHLHGANRKIQRYIRKELCMNHPETYFQAGVLLLNTAEFRKHLPVRVLLEKAMQPYRYHDQDVLNLCCEGRVMFLPMEWNLLTDCAHTRIRRVIVHAPDAVQQAYHRARIHPKIIHYAGHRKPWHGTDEDFGNVFWQYVEKSPYYQTILAETRRFMAEEERLNRLQQQSFYGKLRRFAKKLLRR